MVSVSWIDSTSLGLAIATERGSSVTDDDEGVPTLRVVRLNQVFEFFDVQPRH
jgi:hypothetical protein